MTPTHRRALGGIVSRNKAQIPLKVSDENCEVIVECYKGRDPATLERTIN